MCQLSLENGVWKEAGAGWWKAGAPEPNLVSSGGGSPASHTHCPCPLAIPKSNSLVGFALVDDRDWGARREELAL